MFLAISDVTRVNLNAVVDIDVHEDHVTLHLVVPVVDDELFPGVKTETQIASEFDCWLHITPEFPKYQALRNWIENNTL